MILMEHHITGNARAMYFDGNFHPLTDVSDKYGIAESARVREAIEPAIPPANASDILAVLCPWRFLLHLSAWTFTTRTMASTSGSSLSSPAPFSKADVCQRV